MNSHSVTMSGLNWGAELQHIANLLTLKSDTLTGNGLGAGKTGICLFFFCYARYSNGIYYEKIAEQLLDTIFAETQIDSSCSFFDGLAGLGWMIEYLSSKQLAEVDTDDVLSDIDDLLLKIYRTDGKDPGHLILENIPYVVSRIKSNREEGKSAISPTLLQLNEITKIQCQRLIADLEQGLVYQTSTTVFLCVAFFLSTNGLPGTDELARARERYCIIAPERAGSFLNKENMSEKKVFNYLINKLTEQIKCHKNERSGPRIENETIALPVVAKFSKSWPPDFDLAPKLRETFLNLLFNIEPDPCETPDYLANRDSWLRLNINLNMLKPGLETGLAGSLQPRKSYCVCILTPFPKLFHKPVA